MTSVWDLIESGDFEGACRLADSEASQTTSVLPLRNKVFALLALGRHEEVVRLCEEIIRRQEGKTDSDFIYLGVAFWLLGQRAKAVATWKSAVNTTYTDAAGGVEVHLLLFYAGVRSADELLRKQAERSLRKLVKRPAAGNWPGPIAHFLLGNLGEDQLNEKMSAQPLVRAKQICQAMFYIGVVRFSEGDGAAFLNCMKTSVSQGPICRMNQEFYLARWELDCGSDPR
jgi:hypothetical protein